MKDNKQGPPVDVRVFEITIVVAVPDYWVDRREMDMTGYYELDPEAEQLGFRQRELTVSYRDDSGVTA